MERSLRSSRRDITIPQDCYGEQETWAHSGDNLLVYFADKLVGDFRQFQSPAKAQTPSLRDPNSTPFLFSQTPQTSKPLPSLPATFRQPSFTTPQARKTFDVDFSSGPENASSPENADTEDTPDASRFTTNESLLSKNIFGIYGKSARSPGRGAIIKPPKNYSNKLEKRIRKSRREAQNFERQLERSRRSSDDTEDEEQPQTGRNSSAKRLQHQQQPSSLNLWSWIASRDSNDMVERWTKTFTYIWIMASCVFIMWSVFATIRSEINVAGDREVAALHAEVATCTRQWRENMCEPHRMLPALAAQCNEWALCMEQDPNAARKAVLSAQTFANILNGFLETLSWKTMFAAVFLIAAPLTLINVPGMIFGTRHHYPPPQNIQQFQGHYAQTPQHQFYTGFEGQNFSQVGWNGQQALPPAGLPYGRSPSKGDGQHAMKRIRSKSPEKRNTSR